MMTQASDIQQETMPGIPEIADAISVLLDAVMQLDSEKPKSPTDAPLEIVDAATLLATPLIVWEARSWVKNPHRVALKKGIKSLGKILNGLVEDVDAMLKVAEEICARDPENWGRRMSILDSAFDGVGDWHK